NPERRRCGTPALISHPACPACPELPEEPRKKRRAFSSVRPTHKLSSRAQRPDFLLRAAFWRVGPRSRGIPPQLFSFTLSLFPRFLASRKCHLARNISAKSSPRFPPSSSFLLRPLLQPPHHRSCSPLPRRLLLHVRNKPHNLTPQRRRHPAKLGLRPRGQPQRHRQCRW